MIELVAIGASWGGLNAVGHVLAALPAETAAAVVVAQHRRSRAGEEALARLLATRCALPIADAEDKAPLVPGTVLVAPADYHLLVEPGSVALSVDPPLHHSRPSIDILLGSAGDAYGARAAGVVLTGANADGAAGLAHLERRGGVVVVEDPETAERREMPAAALAAVPGARVLALEEIGPALAGLCATSAEVGG